MDLYIEKIHLQPLPLFDTGALLDHLTTSPRYLLWSFMAVVLHFDSHPFYSGHEAEAITFYTRSANELVTKLVADGMAKAEVLQATCLLALRHILCMSMDDPDVALTGLLIEK